MCIVCVCEGVGTFMYLCEGVCVFILGKESSVSCMLGIHSATESHPRSLFYEPPDVGTGILIPVPMIEHKVLLTSDPSLQLPTHLRLFVETEFSTLLPRLALNSQYYPCLSFQSTGTTGSEQNRPYLKQVGR